MWFGFQVSTQIFISLPYFKVKSKFNILTHVAVFDKNLNSWECYFYVTQRKPLEYVATEAQVMTSCSSVALLVQFSVLIIPIHTQVIPNAPGWSPFQLEKESN